MSEYGSRGVVSSAVPIRHSKHDWCACYGRSGRLSDRQSYLCIWYIGDGYICTIVSCDCLGNCSADVDSIAMLCASGERCIDDLSC